MIALAIIVLVVTLPILAWQSVTTLYTGLRYGRLPLKFTWAPLVFATLALLVLAR